MNSLLGPLIGELLDDCTHSFEVDPARLDPLEDVEANRRNLIALTQRVFGAIISSAEM